MIIIVHHDHPQLASQHHPSSSSSSSSKSKSSSSQQPAASPRCPPGPVLVQMALAIILICHIRYFRSFPHAPPCPLNPAWKPKRGMIGEVVYSKVCDENDEELCNKYILLVHGHLAVVGEDALETCNSIYITGSSIAYQNETMGTFVLQAGDAGSRPFYKSATDYL
jgi:hypothetical protein